MQYDIFISYKRRGTSSATAAYIYDFLIRKGYTVFFDRKEMGQGYFDNQLNEYINNAKDFIVLLEEGSLSACFGINKEDYKTDWFCKEIMQALEGNKRIIPLLLENYKMPEETDLPLEMKRLSKQQALSFESVNIDAIYKEYFIEKKYLSSAPRNIYLSQLEGNGIADFLFYSKQDSEIYEFGNLVGTIDETIDEDHPFMLPVKRSGEHRFRVVNLDTTEVDRIIEKINTDEQKYVEIKWKGFPNVWEERVPKTEVITKHAYQIGLGLYKGNTKYKPDLIKAIDYLQMNKDGINFIRSHINEVVNDEKNNLSVKIKWLEIAAGPEIGSEDAAIKLALMYQQGEGVEKDINKAIDWYNKVDNFHNNPFVVFQLGMIYKERNDNDKALKYLLKAAEKNYEKAYLPLAQMLKDNNKRKALIWLEKLLRIEPENSEALNLQKWIQGKIDEFFSKEVLSLDVAGNTIEMILVEGGKMMTGPTTELRPKRLETPKHELEVPTFYISKYPVTQKIWESIMKSNPAICQEPNLRNAIGGDVTSTVFSMLNMLSDKDNLKRGIEKLKYVSLENPVENVSIDECKDFVRRLSEKTDNKYIFSLPTKEEWEYAARGGQKTKCFQYAGSNNIDIVAWHKGNANDTTHQVGMKLPNELGLFDMSGNVWEWTDTTAHGSGENKVYYVCCGGSFKDDYPMSIFDCNRKSDHKSELGFRIVIRKKDQIF